MERIYPPAQSRVRNNFSRVADLEHSHQWTSLASDIDDLERAKMRDQHPRFANASKKYGLHRRSMPEPQHTSLIYVDADAEDYGPMTENYFLPIEANSGVTDSWSWTEEREESPGKNYENYEKYDYKLSGGNQDVENNRRNDSRNVEENSYGGSREKLHEIFRKNRDLRRQFFAEAPKNVTIDPREFKEFKEPGSGYGSVETLTSQSNHSEISGVQSRRTGSSGRASQNSFATSLTPENGGITTNDVTLENNSNVGFGGNLTLGDKKLEKYYSLPRTSNDRVLDSSSSPGLPSPDFEAPPLPTSDPPFLISGNPPDPPERQESQRKASTRNVYTPDSEGLRMLNRFEARIENRKLSPLLTLQSPRDSRETSNLSKTIYKSMPDLNQIGVSGVPRKGMISRLAVNGSRIDLNFNKEDKPEEEFRVRRVSYAEEPREIRATRVDLSEKLRLNDRRVGVPPPLDLSKVSEDLRQETLSQDRRVLRDYSVESTPLRAEIVKCKVKHLDESSARPAVNVALKTATNLLDLSRNLSRPLIAREKLSAEEQEGDGKTNRFRSSVIVWCDGGVKKEENNNVARISRIQDHRKSIGSLRPSAGSEFPSVYAPIPYRSPRQYVEGEVTIHYRSPVRTEAKEILSEAELAQRSAENMRRVYQEERRRKYLQELHDINSRRHTDNFTPSQKSPIPLNRYDDFVDDLSQRSRSQEQTPEPRLVAKALYNFVGQSSRELTFRRGDIIFVRRQVDKNWYEGEHNAMIGLFPFNYVEILPYDGIRTVVSTPKKPYEGQAKAKFNFLAQTTHELPLVKGDLVVLTRRVDENWYEGRIGNRKGIFPISYVEVFVEPGIRSETPAQNKPVAAPAAHSLLSNGSAGGKLSMGPHHYTPSIPTNTSSPQSHYNSLPRMGGTKLHVAPVNETLHIDTHSEPLRYRSLYNYRPQNDDELELKEGDTVYVMEKCDDGWFVGSSQRTGCFGTFPGNYVERL